MNTLLAAADGMDWQTILTAVGGALVAVLTAIGAAGKFLLDHLSKQRDEQRAHESAMALKYEAVANRFEVTVRDITAEMRKESRETTSTLLEIQKESVEAIGKLSDSVGNLERAVDELRTKVGHEVEPPGPAQPQTPDPRIQNKPSDPRRRGGSGTRPEGGN